jgi:hypothetical protein
LAELHSTPAGRRDRPGRGNPAFNSSETFSLFLTIMPSKSQRRIVKKLCRVSWKQSS